MKQALIQTKEFQKLMRLTKKPDLQDVLSLRLVFEINSPNELWKIFDFVVEKWQEEKSCESMDDMG
jgi:hypothetical protein